MNRLNRIAHLLILDAWKANNASGCEISRLLWSKGRLPEAEARSNRQRVVTCCQRRTKESWMDSGVREGEKRVSGSGGKPLVQPSNWHSIQDNFDSGSFQCRARTNGDEKCIGYRELRTRQQQIIYRVSSDSDLISISRVSLLFNFPRFTS